IGTVLLINPLRETALEDDWAYSRTVQQLLSTGTYRLDDWLAANPIFQIYWGASLSRLAGYSFGTLRVSTLILVLAGLIAFYCLAQEHGLNSFTASLATLALFASPLVLRFSFNFMTDMPFLACSILAMWLYARAIRLRHYPTMLLGSVAASAAILIRQFGVALLLALICVWLLGKGRRAQAPFFLAGLALPALAAVLQVWMASVAPNWAAAYVVQAQGQYFSGLLSDPGGFLLEIIWRLSMIGQYLAFFALPFTLLLLAAWIAGRRGLRPAAVVRQPSWPGPVRLGAASGLVFIGLVLSVQRGAIVMPFMNWYFGEISVPLRLAITLATSVGAIRLFQLVFRRYTDTPPFSAFPASRQFLDFVALFFVLEIFAFFQVGDEYLLVLLPYILIVISQRLQQHLERAPYRIAAIGLLFVSLGLGSLWTRAVLSASEAKWRGGELARAAGALPTQISQNWIWNSYYGMFDEFLLADDNSHRYDVASFFQEWVPARAREAEYVVAEEKRIGWEVRAEIPFEDFWLTTQHVYLLRRLP
ncbi:MAG: glycosyltransferase family 39 protein, partial [Anaerolineales bacterium]